jgi:hypothetical protein
LSGRFNMRLSHQAPEQQQQHKHAPTLLARQAPIFAQDSDNSNSTNWCYILLLQRVDGQGRATVVTCRVSRGSRSGGGVSQSRGVSRHSSFHHRPPRSNKLRKLQTHVSPSSSPEMEHGGRQWDEGLLHGDVCCDFQGQPRGDGCMMVAINPNDHNSTPFSEYVVRQVQSSQPRWRPTVNVRMGHERAV